jgi:hypothetical protein
MSGSVGASGEQSSEATRPVLPGTLEQFAVLFPKRGQRAASPARLALVLMLQYVEGLFGLPGR